MSKNFTQIRKSLLEACEYYLSYNDGNLLIINAIYSKNKLTTQNLPLSLDLHCKQTRIMSGMAIECSNEYQHHNELHIDRNKSSASNLTYVDLEALKLFSTISNKSSLNKSDQETRAEAIDEINECYSSYLKHCKHLAVSELKQILIDPALDDKQASEACEQHLKTGKTLELLMRNRESNGIALLKFLAALTILPAIGLMMKRLIDSNYSSVNFFKPLSQNLTDSLRSEFDLIPRAMP